MAINVSSRDSVCPPITTIAIERRSSAPKRERQHTGYQRECRHQNRTQTIAIALHYRFVPLFSFRGKIVHVITDHVIFREMNPPQALQYIKEIMAEYRTEAYRAKVGEFYPFEEDALEYIIQNLEKRPPRSINQRCGNIASAALQSNKKRGILRGEIEIDMEFVKTMSRSEIDQELE